MGTKFSDAGFGLITSPAFTDYLVGLSSGANVKFQLSNLLRSIGWFDVRSYASINAAVTEIGVTPGTLIIPNAQTLTGDLVIPATLALEILETGSIAQDAAHTVMIGGSFRGHRGCFTGFIAGEITFGATSVAEIDPSWWADTDVGLQCAIDAANVGAVRKTIKVNADITISAQVTLKDYCTLDVTPGCRIIPGANIDLIKVSPGGRITYAEFDWYGDATFDSSCILFNDAFTAVTMGEHATSIGSLKIYGDNTGSTNRGQVVKFLHDAPSLCMDGLITGKIYAHNVNTIFYHVASNAAGNTWIAACKFSDIVTSNCTYLWRDSLSGAGVKRIHDNIFNVLYEGGSGVYVPYDYIFNWDSANLDQLRRNIFNVVAVDLSGHFEKMTLDVAPGGAGWGVGDTITGVTSGESCVIAAVISTTVYKIHDRTGDFTDGEVLTNGIDPADQGVGYPIVTTGLLFNGKVGENNIVNYSIDNGHLGTMEGILNDATYGFSQSTPVVTTGPLTGYTNNSFAYDDGIWNINETGKALMFRQDSYWRKVKFEGKACYDFDLRGGAIGTISLLGSIPDNSTIVRAWYEVITPFASGGDPTVSIGVVTNAPAGIQAALAYNNAAYAAGWHDGIPDGTAANFVTKTTAIRNLCLVVVGHVGVDELTAGKVWIYFDYVVTG